MKTKKKTKKKTKRPNPNDATFRNINALKKRVKRMEDFFIEALGLNWGKIK